METDDILKEIRDSLRRLEKDISAVPQSLSGLPSSRPTEQFPKIELAIDRAVGRRAEKCEAIRKEIFEEKTKPLMERMERLEERVGEIRKDLGGKINGVLGEAAKTSTGAVVSLTDRVEKIADVVLGTRGDPGLEDNVRGLRQWVAKHEAARAKEAEASKFKISAFIQIVGIIVAIGLGIAGLLMR